MVTIYNADFYVEDRHKSCPENIYEASVEILRNAGLIGVKHVNHYGLVRGGYDKKCEVFRRGLMNIFYSDSEESMPETLEGFEKRLPLMSGKQYELASEKVLLGKEMMKFMSKHEPCSVVLPWGLYRTMSICPSLEINTPAGVQSIHYHMRDNSNFGIVQFYKPKKEKDWYDWDIFKGLLFDASIGGFLSLFETPKGFFKKRRHKKKRRLIDKASKLCKEIMINPDSIDKIPAFAKSDYFYECVNSD